MTFFEERFSVSKNTKLLFSLSFDVDVDVESLYEKRVRTLGLLQGQEFFFPQIEFHQATRLINSSFWGAWKREEEGNTLSRTIASMTSRYLGPLYC